MKIVKLVPTVMTLAGALGLSAVSTRPETVISKDVFTDGSYCHMKFESIREDTLASGQPISKDGPYRLSRALQPRSPGEG
ncbi:MAG TPA: hypothetical protein VFP96_11485 [Candidatus Acidoferrum sp.]|nr:hypothetical protein [Candidatus Acidoferrum sp.]